jgi:two-component system chemotaxis response regulator CheB
VAQTAGANAIGAILTGMGDDGARGLLAMRQAGARTLIQDEATAVVWGMPGAAHKLGAAEEIVPLERIAERLLTLARANA